MVSSLDLSCITVHVGVMRRSVARPEEEEEEGEEEDVCGVEIMTVISDGVDSIFVFPFFVEEQRGRQ